MIANWIARRRAAADRQRVVALHMHDVHAYDLAVQDLRARAETMPIGSPERFAAWLRVSALTCQGDAARARAGGDMAAAAAFEIEARAYSEQHRAEIVMAGARVSKP